MRTVTPSSWDDPSLRSKKARGWGLNTGEGIAQFVLIGLAAGPKFDEDLKVRHFLTLSGSTPERKVRRLLELTLKNLQKFQQDISPSASRRNRTMSDPTFDLTPAEEIAVEDAAEQTTRLIVIEGGKNAAGDIVKCCVLQTDASFENNWLGGLLGLFLAINKSDAGNYLWNQFEALEPAPMFLGFQAE